MAKALERRPPKAERDALRRNQIALAAKLCFVRHGFHAASMAQIAAQARMSVGQIYRYFDSKEAIVETIVEMIASRRLGRIPKSDVHSMAHTLAYRDFNFDEEHDADHTLMLEVAAEATRNPRVAKVVAAYDRILHGNLVKRIRARDPGLSEAAAEVHVEFMAVLFEGTAFRRNTKAVTKPELLEKLYEEALGRLRMLKNSSAEVSVSFRLRNTRHKKTAQT